MRPGEFSLYGHRFRWSDSNGADASPEEIAITLVPSDEPFPTESVEWLSRSNGYIPGYGKLGTFSAYHFEGVAHFLFPHDGRFLKIFVHPGADHTSLEFALYRGVLPRILHLRGTTCLHASAVAGEDGVVAFVGPSGAGKSTLAAALVSRGWSLVSDDVLPLRLGRTRDEVLAGPGLPELRLHPATADVIGIGNQVAAPIQGQTKARWQPRRAPDVPLPLQRIYLLEPSLRGTSALPATELSMPRPEALLDLISNSFWVHPGETGALARDMICLGGLLRSVAVTRLVYELTDRGFEAVDNLVASTVKVSAR